MRRLIRCSLVLLASAAPLAAQSPRLGAATRGFVVHDDSVIALVGVRLIDGTGARVRSGQTIVVRNGRIAAVGPSAATPVPPGARTIELPGATVLPGLVMVHEHLYYPVGRTRQILQYASQIQSFPKLYLAAGVTTMRTGGALEPYADLSLAAAIARGELPGPRIHVTGPYIDRQGTGIMQLHALTGPEDARRLVRYWAEQGVTSFKVYNYLTREDLKAVIEEAHARKLQVTGHLCSITLKEAVALGIDNIEHGLIASTDLVAGKKPDVCPNEGILYRTAAEADVEGPAVRAIIQAMVDRGVALTSTLPIFETIVEGAPMVSRASLEAMSEETRLDYLQMRPLFAERKDSLFRRAFRNEMRFERLFVEAGGLLVAGSDPTGYGGTIAGAGNHREIELLVDAGFPPEEAIRIASLNGAKLLRQADEVGSVEPGKRADLVVVDGDPAASIRDIRKVRWVFKDGVSYDAARLNAAVRGWVGRY